MMTRIPFSTRARATALAGALLLPWPVHAVDLVQALQLTLGRSTAAMTWRHPDGASQDWEDRGTTLGGGATLYTALSDRLTVGGRAGFRHADTAIADKQAGYHMAARFPATGHVTALARWTPPHPFEVEGLLGYSGTVMELETATPSGTTTLSSTTVTGPYYGLVLRVAVDARWDVQLESYRIPLERLSWSDGQTLETDLTGVELGVVYRLPL